MSETIPGARKVPRISLASYTDGDAADRSEFTRDLSNGLTEYGFVVIYDHGISDALLTKAYRLSEALFELDEETKLGHSGAHTGGQRGYTAFGIEHAKDAEAIDLKEFWHVGQELAPGSPLLARYPENIWPAELPEFKDAFVGLYRALEKTGRIMLRALAPALDVADGYFDDMTEDGNSILRLLHYPPIPTDADPRSIRAAAHEDINLITLLVSASASGLQLLDRDGRWMDIESYGNDIIVDSGDMLARLTNEVYPATTHRVVNPDDANTSRFSMPFFMHPHPDAVLSCLASCKGDGAKYPDITAQAFLEERLREIGLIS